MTNTTTVQSRMMTVGDVEFTLTYRLHPSSDHYILVDAIAGDQYEFRDVIYPSVESADANIARHLEDRMDERDRSIAAEQRVEAAVAAQSQRTKAVEDILAEHGIRMSIGSCGCCSSPWLTFEYRGEMIVENLDDAGIDMFED